MRVCQEDFTRAIVRALVTYRTRHVLFKKSSPSSYPAQSAQATKADLHGTIDTCQYAETHAHHARHISAPEEASNLALPQTGYINVLREFSVQVER